MRFPASQLGRHAVSVVFLEDFAPFSCWDRRLHRLWFLRSLPYSTDAALSPIQKQNRGRVDNRRNYTRASSVFYSAVLTPLFSGEFENPPKGFAMLN